MMGNITTYEILTIMTTLSTAATLVYIVYMRFLHPLTKYPGPLLATLTNGFKAYYVYNLRLHVELECSLRRRQLSRGFSQASVQKLEPLIEGQMEVLIDKLRAFAKTGEVFDFKNVLSLYVLGILEELHAINDHLRLAGVIGELPFQGLKNLKAICSRCVNLKINNPSGRPDLLKSLFEAVDPESGSRLTEQEINSEAFAVLVAGSHSTSGTLTLLLWHLTHNPDILAIVAKELHEKLPPLREYQISYPIQDLEASLCYTMACVRENFRMNPVFTMPLWRRVGYPGGLDIAVTMFQRDVCISNYVLRHNPDIWGADHEEYNPARWLHENYSKEKGKFLIPFSIGHRMCIGRNLAMTNILKTITTLLVQFDFEPVDKERRVSVQSSGIEEMQGQFLCRVSIK
ncbi:hypothetical protein N7486_000238 [Penicillium sp. IBT 16267x]|nr:hypothetical protein N7486_000238 [Penicillium sp. IBT 16267x]